MLILGLNKTNLLDYPEHVAATIFTGGCNFRCPFCQNGDLVLNPGQQPVISEEEVLAVLRKRQGILQGVCITGGEPTLQKDLKDFIIKVKDLGYLVKLDTNGYRPEVLKELLAEERLDYVAMDVKASLENYAKVAGCPGMDLERIRESIALLKGSSIPYEFRTTVVKGLHTFKEFEEIGKLLEGSRAYYLRAFRESERVLGLRMDAESGKLLSAEEKPAPVMEAFSAKEMERMAEIARKFIDKVEIRGIE